MFPFRREPKSIFEEALANVDLSGESALSVEVKKVHFVLVLVRADDHLIAQDRLGKFVKVVGEEKGMIMSMIAPLALASATVPWSQGDESDRMERMVAGTMREVGEDAKVLSGCLNAPCGVFEFGHWANYGVMLPNFEKLLVKLIEAPFGSAIRVD